MATTASTSSALSGRKVISRPASAARGWAAAAGLMAIAPRSVRGGLVRSVLKGEPAVGLFVEQVVEQRQQRHGLLLDVRDLALHEFDQQLLEQRRSGRGQRLGRRRARQRRQFGDHGTDGVVLLGQQRRHVAVAGLGHERKELLFLEVEVAADLVLQVVLQRACQRRRASARRCRGQRLLDAAEQVEQGAVFVVEAAADLAEGSWRGS